MSTNYTNAYKLLNLPRSADWQSARVSYRRHVQACHPDKFTAGSAEAETAHERFLEINSAFELLQSFYRENNKLPLEPDTLSDSEFSRLHQKQTATSTTGYSSRKKSRNNTSSGTISKIPFIVGLAIIVFLAVNSSREGGEPIRIEGDISIEEMSPKSSVKATPSWNHNLGSSRNQSGVLGTSQTSVGDSLNGRLFERQR